MLHASEALPFPLFAFEALPLPLFAFEALPFPPFVWDTAVLLPLQLLVAAVLFPLQLFVWYSSIYILGQQALSSLFSFGTFDSFLVCLGRNWVYDACCSVQTIQFEPASLAKQTTCARVLPCRDANSSMIVIPWGFRESGNGSGKLKPIPRVSGPGSGKFRGVFYFRFEVNLKFLSIKKNFFRIFFRNPKNEII